MNRCFLFSISLILISFVLSRFAYFYIALLLEFVANRQEIFLPYKRISTL